MTDLKRVTADGFIIPDRGGRLIDLSLLSLKIALKAYFSTYNNMNYRLHIFDGKGDLKQSEIDSQHTHSYFEACSESIVHFQHFTELFIKEALRKEHPLLVNEASSKPLMLYKLLKRQPITSSEQETINTIEFSDAFTRFICLLKEGKIKDTKLQSVRNYEEPLRKLNILRNRMWHRGTFVLRYPALDEYIGKYILPFVNEIFVIRRYSHLVDLWKYGLLNCGIDPITEIINIFQKGKYDIGKIALLKAMGRAAYANPMTRGAFFKYFNKDIRVRAERIAEGEVKGSYVEKVSTCPVCGVESLVIYNETCSNADDLGEDEVLEEPYKVWQYTWQVKCMCCTFEIHDDVGNPSTYGLPIEDYWHSTQIR